MRDTDLKNRTQKRLLFY